MNYKYKYKKEVRNPIIDLLEQKLWICFFILLTGKVFANPDWLTWFWVFFPLFIIAVAFAIYVLIMLIMLWFEW